MIDSTCITWIELEERYRITILKDGSPLITRYAYSMNQVIDILKEEENAA